MKSAMLGFALLFCTLALWGAPNALAAPADAEQGSIRSDQAIERRPMVLPTTPQGWGGLGVCYGPYRDGQRPGGPMPTEAQVREDLHIIARHWSILRIYSVRDCAEQVCRIIREEKLPLKVLAGAWIAQESRRGPDGTPTALDEKVASENREDVAAVIKLANDYPDVVMAVNIGNEALVDWSAHRVPASVIIGYLREARAATKVPVTTCDTETFWTTQESIEVARECDFLALHAYAIWNRQTIRDAMNWTRSRISAVQKLHPDLPIVMTEVGWATNKGTQGDQSRLILVDPDERDQEVFFRAFRDWAVEQKLPYFYFEAFDEPWKGGSEPGEVEKHWGVYKVDRSPKLVFQPSAALPSRPGK